MQAQQQSLPYARLNTFHGTKRQLLGNQAGHAPPAWRTNSPATNSPAIGAAQLAKGKAAARDPGSKIFLSMLPTDVGEKEVEELFRKTVGPVKESFVIYNSQGKSKGMAIVTFQRAGDATVAREKYDGKIVDGRRPIKIEIIVDGVPARTGGPAAPPSLLNRLSLPASTAPAPLPAKPKIVIQTPQVPLVPVIIPPRRIRVRKGPKRLKKYEPATKAQLDKEMEDYRAAAPDIEGL